MLAMSCIALWLIILEEANVPMQIPYTMARTIYDQRTACRRGEISSLAAPQR